MLLLIVECLLDKSLYV